jgi:hypothetical protein
MTASLPPFTLALLLIGAGCATDPPGGLPDGGERQAELLLGTGTIGVFEEVHDGDTVLLARGCQGSQHVWLSLRTRGMDPRRNIIQARLDREDGALVSLPTQVILTLLPVDGTEYHELTGIPIQVPNPDEIAGRMGTMFLTVTEGASTGGRKLTETRDVQVEWGTEVCGESDGGALPRTDGGRDVDAGLADGGRADAEVADAGRP